MPFDFQKSRVNVDDALAQAISARDVMAHQTAASQSVIEATSKAYSEAGRAIGGGLERGLTAAFDPSNQIVKQAATQRAMAAQQDYAMEQQSLALGATRENKTIGQLMSERGSPLSPRSEEAQRLYEKNTPGGIPYSEVPPEARQAFEAELDQLNTTQMPIHKGPKGAGFKLGPHGSVANVGMAAEEGIDFMTSKKAESVARFKAHPAYLGAFSEAAVNYEMKQKFIKEGKAGIAQAIDDNPHDKHMQGVAIDTHDLWTSSVPVMDGKTIKQLKASGALTRQNIERLVDMPIEKVPRVALLTGEDGKPDFHAEWDKYIAENLSAKETSRRAIFDSWRGRPSLEAANDYYGLEVGAEYLKKLTGGELLKDLKGEQAQIAKGELQTLNAELAKIGDSAGAAMLARTMGLATISNEALINTKASYDADPKVFQQTLDSLMKRSPALKSMFSPSVMAGLLSPGQIRRNELVEQNSQPGYWPQARGPLAPLKDMKISSADFLQATDSFMKATKQGPGYGAMVDTLMRGGFDGQQSEKMANQLAAAMEEKEEAGLESIGPDGKSLRQAGTPAQIKKFREKSAAALARQIVDAAHPESAWRGATDNGFGMPFDGASKVVKEAVGTFPDLKEGKGQVVRGGVTIYTENGTPIAQKVGTETRKFGGNAYQENLSQALQVANVMQKTSAATDTRPLPKETAKGMTGDPELEGVLFNAGSADLPLYSLTKQALGSKQPANIAVKLLNEADAKAKALSMNRYDFKKRLALAAQTTHDPVIEGLSGFLEHASSPTSTTMKDIEMAEGHDPSELIRDAANKQLQAQAQGHSKGMGDILGVSQRRKVSEGYVKNFQEKTMGPLAYTLAGMKAGAEQGGMVGGPVGTAVGSVLGGAAFRGYAAIMKDKPKMTDAQWEALMEMWGKREPRKTGELGPGESRFGKNDL